MGSAGSIILPSSRVPGFTGRGDKYLGEIARELRRVLWKTQSTFSHPSCRLPDIAWSEVAVLLVEWAEDIHNDIGLWRTVEAYQHQCFGTPLPQIVDAGSENDLAGFDPRRIQFYLWISWSWMNPELTLSPKDVDLTRLAEAASRLLTDRFARLPKDSGVKQFLATPNDYGWDVKRKLLWMGINSYLFRNEFLKCLDVNGYDPDIENRDDFVCAHTSEWSGLGVIDVLAGTLDLSEQDRATLRTWYERHVSFFRVLSWHEEGGEIKTIAARNVVNGEPYAIRMHCAAGSLKPGIIVTGGLTPWRGEWVWSGKQKIFSDVPEHEELNLRRRMFETSSAIAYRYCTKEAAEALEATRNNHAKFVAEYGNDLVVFANGLEMAAAEQNRIEAEWRMANPEHVAQVMHERGLTKPGPSMKLAQKILDHKDGIGLFYNPDEGLENALQFNLALFGLRKKGVGMTEEETEILQGYVKDENISPAFIRRLVDEHGIESLAEAFVMRHGPPAQTLEFLLRRYKGHFYRNRYPSMIVLQGIGKQGEQL